MRSFLFALGLLLIGVNAHAGTISGVVTDGRNGSPLVGMTVSAYDASGSLRANGVSAAAGHYSFNLPAGTYRVLAYDPNGFYATSFFNAADSFESASPIELAENQNVTIDFPLEPGGHISGHAVADNGGALLSSMTVAIYNLSGTLRGRTTTDATGAYSILVPAGSYKVAAWDDASNYLVRFYNAAGSFNSASTVAVEAQSTTGAIDIRLLTAARVSGTVSESATGQLLPNIVVSLYATDGSVTGRATSNATGSYLLAVPAGNYKVVAEDPTGSFATTFYPQTESFSTSQTVAAQSGQTSTANLSMLSGGRIVEHVFDASTGTPLPDITIAAFNDDGTTRGFVVTDASGAYRTVLPQGQYRLAAFDNTLTYLTSFYPAAETFTAAPRWSVVPQTEQGGFDFRLNKGGVATGTVTANGVAAGGIIVGAYNPQGSLLNSSTTDAQGHYRLLLVPGWYKLVASDPLLRFANDYSGGVSFDTAETLNFVAGESRTVDLSLSPAGTISGVVSDEATGATLGQILIAAYDSSGFLTLTVSTTSSGTFQMPLPAGSYKLVASDPLRRYASSFYLNAPGFDSARQLTVVSGQAIRDIGFRMNRVSSTQRRHAVREPATSAQRSARNAVPQ